MIKDIKDILIVIAVMLLIGVVLYKVDKCNNTSNFSKIEQVISTDTTKALSDSTLYQELINHNIKYPEVVLAQAKLESGNYTSGVYRKTNNLFGMGIPERRSTCSTGSFKGKAIYTDWQSSVKDYKRWQQCCFKDGTIVQYYELLSNRYAEDTLYAAKVKQIASQYD